MQYLNNDEDLEQAYIRNGVTVNAKWDGSQKGKIAFCVALIPKGVIPKKEFSIQNVIYKIIKNTPKRVL